VVDETERVRRAWDKNAARYDKQVEFFERRLFDGGREWACSRATGRVLEIAIGTGRNLPFYGPGVSVVGIDISDETLAFARERAQDVDIDVELQRGDAQDLPFEDESFDTVVSTLTMCNIPDYGSAQREAKRVLKPGGSLVMMEHVKSDRWWIQGAQRAFNWLTIRIDGDHLTRDPLTKARANGFDIVEFENLKLGIVHRIHARKPVA
jgi:ubiquinone/menaquinone biosynthesis C-methylase UbiE